MAEEPIEDLEIADELIAERRSADLDQLPDDMESWMKKIIWAIDTFSLWTGKIVSFLLVPMCFAMVYEVIARKFFIAPTMWAYDISRMFDGALFMLGSAYALSRGVHIRADFIYRNWKQRNQAIVDIVLYIFLFFPGMIVFFYMSVDYAWESWERGEKGMDTAWMPAMGPIKTALPVGIAFLIIQGVSEVLKCMYAIKNGRWPV